MSEEKQELGTKELIEFLDALKVLAVFAGGVLKDGKVDAKDLASLASLGIQFPVLMSGFSGLPAALDEAKDLDKPEVVQILNKLYEAVAAFELAKK